MDVLFSFIFLKTSGVRALAVNRSAQASAFGWILFAALFVTLGYFFFPTTEGAVVYRPDFAWALFHFVKLVLVFSMVFFASAVLLQAFWKREFSFVAYFRLLGHAHVVFLLALYPPFSIVGFLWFCLLYWRILGVFFDLKNFPRILMVVFYGVGLWFMALGPAFTA